MIICSETTIDKIYTGNIVVEQSSLKVTGIVNGDITVMENASLKFHGILNANITINPNAAACIHGTVNGIINNYGHLELYRIVDKVNNHSDHFIIYENAIINDEKY